MGSKVLGHVRGHAVAYAALFLAVGGGGAYAATSLPANSVGTKQIKNGAVTLPKIAHSAQTALRGARGARGPQGAPGPGAKGFFIDTSVNRADGTVFTTGDFKISVACNEGQVFVTSLSGKSVAVNGSAIRGPITGDMVFGSANGVDTDEIATFLSPSTTQGASVAFVVGNDAHASFADTIQPYASSDTHTYRLEGDLANLGSGKCAAYGDVITAG